MTRTPLTAYQRDLWTACAAFPGRASYNVAGRLRFTGAVDADALAGAARRMLARHDALRLRFGVDDGVPYQWVDTEPGPVEVVDLSGAADPEAACTAWMDERALEPVDLTAGQICRAAVVVRDAAVTYLFFRAHHLQVDGTALFVALAGLLSGADPDGSFLDHVGRERESRDSPEWAGSAEALKSAMDGVVPALFTRRGNGEPPGRHTFTIDRATFDRFAAGEHTFYAHLVAAVATYLGRVHSAGEVVVGIPFDNRADPRDARVVGNLANTVPVRLAPSAAASMAELVGQAQHQVLAAKEHERVALGDLLRALRTRQLFDVTVTFTRMPDGLLDGLLDAVDQWQGWPHGHTPYPLAIAVREYGRADDVVVELDHDPAVFDDDLPIESVGRHLMALLLAGLDRPDEPLSRLPMLTPAEHHDLVVERNRTTVAYRDTETVHGLFAQRVAAHPERVAVAWQGGALTYAELDRRANQLAHALRATGIRPGERVAVAIERGPELLVALLATLTAGGAYVPVDPGHPAERIEFLLADSRAGVLLVRGDPPAAVPPGTTVIDVDAPRDEPATAPEPTATARDLAYVIYTSGSTGRPKGVLVEHRSVVNRLAWMQRFTPLGPDDVVLHKTPSSFDVSVWELFWWAVEGAGVALLPPGAENDPLAILDRIAAHGVTVVHFVPAMLEPVLDLLERRPDLLARIRTLRAVFCSGEALPARLVERFDRVTAGHRPRLVNLYGPTETTVDVTYHECAPGGERVPIGRPIDNTRVYVLDPGGLPQPVGVAGELCVAGVGVARGYLDRPELTARRFVDDPFHPGRMYRTGDLARWLASGELEYLGRLDRQVKIRGNRVELGEVEHALAALPDLRDVVVVDVSSPERGTHLVAHYVAGHDLPVEDLRAHLTQRLPGYMIPARFHRIDRIPLSPNGKVDRAALPAAPGRTPAPATGTRATLAGILAEVLEVDQVGLHDNYYALGGDSILVLRVCALAERHGLDLRPHDVAEHPTVDGLAEVLAGRSAPVSPAPGLAPFALVAGVDRPKVAHAADAYPVTRLQLGMLFHSREHDGSTRYRDVFRYRLRLDWHEDAFRAAFAALVARHPALRTSFRLGDLTEPLQLVHHDVAPPLEIDGADTVDAHVERWRRRDYRLDRAPLFHVRVRPHGDTVDLVIAFHHALFDGWSLATLLADLLTDYRRRLGHDVPAEPAVEPPGYAEFVAAERAALASEPSREYWRELLAGSRATTLPGFRRHEPRAAAGRTSVWRDLPPALHADLTAFAAGRGLPVKSVLLAAHCLTLRLFSGETDLTTGLVSHARPARAGADRAVGLYLNTMPLRVGTESVTWGGLAERVAAQERASARHHQYPLSAIQDDLGGDPVLETSFNYVDFHQLRAAGIELLGVEAHEETNFLLAVTAAVDPRTGGLALRVDGDPAVITPGQADLIAESYVDILGLVVRKPDDQVDLGVLATPPAAEPLADPPHVVTLFARQAGRTPDAVAVVDGDRRWDYRTLHEAAGRVAHTLRSLGAPRGCRIGVALERSPEAVATVIGIALAGAACVPLDLTYPASRLADLQDQARPFRVVVAPRHAHLVTDPATVLPVTDALTGPAPSDTEPPALADTAYVLFTSGSTGRPKGVALPHRALANMVTWQLAASSGRIEGRAPHTVQYAPPSFDVFFQEVYATLCGGGTLHLVSEQDRRDPVRLLGMLDRAGVERMFLPYVALQQLAVTAQRLSLRPRALRIIAPAGEQLRVTDEIRALCKGMTDPILENQYGLTETHLVTAYTMDGDPDGYPELPPIGHPVDGAVVRVLDERLRPVPDGVPGEIFLGGNSLADGYEGRPDLTAERFVRDPYGPPGARLVRTGDLGRRLPGGAVVCDGRIDRQVKVRGFRVEPAEVELAILDLAPAVREAAVVVRAAGGATAADGDGYLTAYLVGDRDAVDLAALRGALRARLPEHLNPKYLEWLDALPLTPSGKRADAVLAARQPTDTGRPPYVAPRDPAQRAIADIVSEVLGVDRVGVHDDFFAVGGTSLSAMRLVVTVEKRFGVELSIAGLTAAPTVAGLAAQLGEVRAAPDPLVPLRTEGTGPPLFLVHPIGGSVLPYVGLARYLPDRPLYGLQAAGIDPGTSPRTSFADMARDYVDAIRRVQPDGPYHLGGWSLGATIAAEMTHLLVAAGQRVERLVFVDPLHVRASESTADLAHTWFLRELLHRWDATPVAIPSDVDTEEGRLRFVLDQAVAAGVLPAGASLNLVRRLFGVFSAALAAGAGYQPRPVPVDVAVVNAAGPLPEILAGALRPSATRLSTGRVRAVEVPGDHFTMMTEPHLRRVGEQIAAALRRQPLVRVDRPAAGVALVTLDRAGTLNGIDRALAAELTGTLTALADDDTVSAVVLTGAGQGFSVGADIGEPAGLLAPALAALRRLGAVTVAAVTGPALGAGRELALACDHRIAGPTALFGAPGEPVVRAAEAVRHGLVTAIADDPVGEAITVAAQGRNEVAA